MYLRFFSKKNLDRPLQIAEDKRKLRAFNAENARTLVEEQRKHYRRERQDILDGLVQSDNVTRAVDLMLEFVLREIHRKATVHESNIKFFVSTLSIRAEGGFNFSGHIQDCATVQGRYDFRVARYITDLLLETLREKKFQIHDKYEETKNVIDSETVEKCEILKQFEVRW